MIIFGLIILAVAITAYNLGFRDGRNITVDRLVQRGWLNVDATKKQVTSFLKGQSQ